VIGFGQCATGIHWKDKVAELQAEAWCKLWLNDFPVQEPFRTFFIPHAIEADVWQDVSLNAGLLFDRVRIARYAGNLAQSIQAEIDQWNRVALEPLRGSP
jgi:hypothetical protein